ncbi:MAG TPA: ABC transporter substrate-binding protein [Acidimicrobiales bacterium]|nr:ABC transporter substrate-binding protein [Acidimicrobiales bacterium]
MFGQRSKGYRRRVTAALGLSAAMAAGSLGVGLSGAGAATVKGLSGKAPIHLAFLWQVKGESSYAIQDFQNGALLAVKAINKAGGVDGHKITFTRYPVTPVTTSQAISEYIKAAQTKPVAMLGPPGPIQETLVRYENQYKIPILSVSPTQLSEVGQKYGTVWRFNPYAPIESYGAADVQYAVDKLHAKNLGMISSPDASDAGIAAAAEAEAKKLGATISVQKTIAVTATDATGQVLAMKGVDAVLAFSYENPVAVIANQMAQNGIDVPILGYDGAFPDVTSGLIKGQAKQNFAAVTGCSLYGGTVPSATKRLSALYKQTYGTAISIQAAETYETIYVVAHAIGVGRSVVATTLRKTLSSDSYSGRVCTPTYRADAQHNMTHLDTVYSFAGATPSPVYRYTVPFAHKA